ncbi:alpha-1,3-fucosyltransferase 10, glycosyltransferase family 10 protein [Pseudohyphozyma bogoriensis]|nr:alpha-1,3-fucosyltransferase 10, glycosyltransferase family 10 protein [Pseudohyphozyma bogoriensis]
MPALALKELSGAEEDLEYRALAADEGESDAFLGAATRAPRRRSPALHRALVLLAKGVGIIVFFLWTTLGVLYLVQPRRELAATADSPSTSLDKAPASSSSPDAVPTVRIHYRDEQDLSQREPLVAPQDCPINVIFTNDERSSDIVIFNANRNSGGDFNRQAVREQRPWQSAAIWSSEAAPQRNVLQGHYDKWKEGLRNETFDYDMTYRLDSTVPGVYAYNYFGFDNEPLPYEQKRGDIAIFTTNCAAKNQRSLIMKELIELMPGQVDSFGSCHNTANAEQKLKEWELWDEVGPNKNSWNIKVTAIGRYKFTVAMENSNDIDYVTEKYFQAMERGTVPIHLGTPTFRSSFMASDNSAIDLADFMPLSTLKYSRTDSSPAQELTSEEKAGVAALAERLKFLVSPEGREEYESMLDWKKDGKWRDTPFGQVVRLGRMPLREECRLAGTHLGLEWAKSGWVAPEGRNTTDPGLSIPPPPEEEGEPTPELM